MGETFDPTLHIIPLDAEKLPVVLTVENGESHHLVGITDCGRISFFALDKEDVDLDGERIGVTYPLVNQIIKTIDERFPDERDAQGNDIKQYIAVGVMYGEEGKQAKFIYNVLGSSDYSANLGIMHDNLKSLQGLQVGGEQYQEIENFFKSDDVSNWINELIDILKGELDWSNYVKKALESE